MIFCMCHPVHLNCYANQSSCTDSILVGGMGSIYCKDPEELTALQAAPVQQVINATLTDKG